MLLSSLFCSPRCKQTHPEAVGGGNAAGEEEEEEAAPCSEGTQLPPPSRGQPLGSRHPAIDLQISQQLQHFGSSGKLLGEGGHYPPMSPLDEEW